MALENYKKKIGQERKAKKVSPYTITTIIPEKGGGTKMVTKQVSREEYLEVGREDAYIHNQEAPFFEYEMSNDDADLPHENVW